jgi:hypothetical protein
MPDVIRARRAELGMSRAQSAAAGARQIRRYEAGEPSQRVNPSGDRWAGWQSSKDGVEMLNAHQVRCLQRGDGYVSTEGAIRSKSTMYLHLHQHGQDDGPIVTGRAALARSEAEAREVLDGLRAAA